MRKQPYQTPPMMCELLTGNPTSFLYIVVTGMIGDCRTASPTGLLRGEVEGVFFDSWDSVLVILEYSDEEILRWESQEQDRWQGNWLSNRWLVLHEERQLSML